MKIECLGKELFEKIKEERFVLTSAQQEKLERWIREKGDSVFSLHILKWKEKRKFLFLRRRIMTDFVLYIDGKKTLSGGIFQIGS